MRFMVRRGRRLAQVLTCAALALALSAGTAVRCFVDEAATGMACCAEMGRACDHASVQQGCCAVNAPGNESPAISSRIDHVRAPQLIAAPVENALWQASLRGHFVPDRDAGPTRLSRPTYLLISAFRI
jgi:hypothetical protein